MSSYADDLDTPANKEFVKAWHEAYGPNSYPDFMSAATLGHHGRHLPRHQHAARQSR